MLPQGMALDRVPSHSCAELRRIDQDTFPGADQNGRLPSSDVMVKRFTGACQLPKLVPV